MITQLITTTLLTIFADFLLWKVGFWPWVQSIGVYLISDIPNCELCRSFWLTLFIFVVFGNICTLQDLLIIPMATAAKLILEKQNL